jgi:hypothetical protein
MPEQSPSQLINDWVTNAEKATRTTRKLSRQRSRISILAMACFAPQKVLLPASLTY